MGRIFKLVTGLFMLVAIIGVSLYVALQNQDIRNRAGKAQEYMQLTPLKLYKHRVAITRVVMNNLQSNLLYRLVLTISYTPNPEHLPPQGIKTPGERKRTLRIKDNKTYSFLYRLQSCYFVPHITVKLYSREKGKRYQEVSVPSVTTTELTPPCSTTTVTQQPSPKGTETHDITQESSNSGSQPTIAPTAPPQTIEVTNGDIPDSAGEDSTDPQAIDVETIEDVSAMDTESNNATTENQTHVLPTIVVSTTMAQASITPISPNQNQQVATLTTIQPTSLPTSTKTQTGVPSANPTGTTGIQPTTAASHPSPTSTSVVLSPTPRTLAELLPSPTQIRAATPTSIPFLQTITIAPSLPTAPFIPSPTTDSTIQDNAQTNESSVQNQHVPEPTQPSESTVQINNSLPIPTAQVPFYQESTTTQSEQIETSITTFGSLNNLLPTLTPTPTSKTTSSTHNLALNAQVSTPTTTIGQPPLSDFAGRSYAENNATPTPFLLYNPNATIIPTQEVIQNDKNPLVPEVPITPSQSSKFSLFSWLSNIIQFIIHFFVTLGEGIKQTIQTFFG